MLKYDERNQAVGGSILVFHIKANSILIKIVQE